MKSIFLGFLFLMFAGVSWAVDQIEVKLTNVKMYLPQGFDDNDLVEVQLSGSLPDLCFRQPKVKIEKINQKIIFEVVATVFLEPQGCRKISLPFLETAQLGYLAEGEYELVLKQGDKEETQKLTIKHAQSSLQDDFLYGNVLFLEENEADRSIELKGINPVNCLVFDRLEADIQKAVVVLKPLFKEQGECRQEPTPFVINYEVPYLPSHPRGILLHIRTMNGKSYNYLYRNLLRK